MCRLIASGILCVVLLSTTTSIKHLQSSHTLWKKKKINDHFYSRKIQMENKGGKKLKFLETLKSYPGISFHPDWLCV